jgi:hypothetical protein
MLIKFQRNISTIVQQLNYIQLGLIRSHLKLTVFFFKGEKRKLNIYQKCAYFLLLHKLNPPVKKIIKKLVKHGKA